MEEQAKYQTKMNEMNEMNEMNKVNKVDEMNEVNKVDKVNKVDAVNEMNDARLIPVANEEAPRTRDEQKILNTRLRLALRTGALPFRFLDDQEKHYRKIIYSTGVEVGKKFTANKDGNVWTVREVDGVR